VDEIKHLGETLAYTKIQPRNELKSIKTLSMSHIQSNSVFHHRLVRDF